MPKASCRQQSNDDNSDVVDGQEMQDTLDMSESRNEDDREEAELKRMQRRSVGSRKNKDSYLPTYLFILKGWEIVRT